MGDHLAGPGTSSTGNEVFAGLAAANAHAAQVNREMREQSRMALPELTALLEEKRILFSPDRKWAIIMDGYGSVELRRKRVNGFPLDMKVASDGYTETKSTGIKSALTLLQLFEKMEQHKNYREDPVSEHLFFPSREEWA
jgi:hypothetical protein